MPLPSAVRTSAFRLTVFYAGVFGVSALTLLGVLTMSALSLLDRQIDETIAAEIRGLAEQYRQQGLRRLVTVLRTRSDQANDEVYLLVDPEFQPLAGNLESWPQQAGQPGDWVNLELERLVGDEAEIRAVRGHTFLLRGDYRLLVGRDARARTRFRDTMVTILAWSAVATVVVGIGGGVFVSRRVLARVERVSSAAEQFMAGDFGHRIHLPGHSNEFDRLADGLNAMLDRIEHLMTGMRLATDSLAHDLRGPLTRLKARIELALRSPSGADADRRALEDVLAQADAAIALFDGLLSIALAESGAIRREMTTVDLADVAAEAVDLYQPVAEDKGIGLDMAETVPAPVRAEPQFLAQALVNVIDNAVKYTPAGGQVAVSVTTKDGQPAVMVADTGPGIAADARDRVLERFVRLEESRTSPGAGLGLSLVAAVCRLHKATLTLESNDPGLRVVIRFPAESAIG